MRRAIGIIRTNAPLALLIGDGKHEIAVHLTTQTLPHFSTRRAKESVIIPFAGAHPLILENFPLYLQSVRVCTGL